MFFPLILAFPISALNQVFICIWAVRNSLMKNAAKGTSLAVQLLRLCTPNAGSPGSIPGQGTRFHMLWLNTAKTQHGQKKKKKLLEDIS